MEDIMKELQAPFTPEEIEWRVGNTNADKTKGMALVYVTNRAIQDRLDKVLGVFGWQNQFKEWRAKSQLCGISVWTGAEWITKWDGADDSDFESTKGGLSDSMKRAAYQWGIGRYLYKLDTVWMPIKQQGRSYVLTQTPELPDWALPEGYVKQKKSVNVKEAPVGEDPPYESPAPWEDDFGGTVVNEGEPVITANQLSFLNKLIKQNKLSDVRVEEKLKKLKYEGYTLKELPKKNFNAILDEFKKE